MKKPEQFEDLLPKPNTIWFKLWKAKQEIGKPLTKNAKRQPHFKSKYADLNAMTRSNRTNST
jgi:hypothetical protein